MNEYQIELSPGASDDLARLPDELRGVVAEHLYVLADDPTGLSRPSATPPYPPGFQTYEFDYVFLNKWHRFVALFNYSDDEATLLIHGIGHAEYDLPDEDDEPSSFS